MKRKIKHIIVTAGAVILAINLILAAPIAGGSQTEVAGCNDNGGSTGNRITDCQNEWGEKSNSTPGCTADGTGTTCGDFVSCRYGIWTQ